MPNSKYFCIAPFVHIMNSPSGIPSPCCMYGRNIIDMHERKSLVDAFYGEEWTELRKTMMKGEYIEGCKVCYDNEQKGTLSLREDMNSLHSFDEFISAPRLSDIQLSVSNKCNFKCVTCNVQSSDSWYEEEKELSNIIPRMGFPYEHSNALLESYEQIDEIPNDLDVLRLVGGEPFMENKLYDLLKKLDLEEKTIYFVTNNSIFPKKWINLLDKAKFLHATISIDGIYDVGEFVRYGFNMNRFTRNLIKWLNFLKPKNSRLSFHYVFHNLNVLNTVKTVKWLNQFDYGKVEFTALYEPKYLDIKYLPDQTKELIMNELEDSLAKSSIISHMKSGTYDKEQCTNFINYTNFLENRKQLPPESEIIYDSVMQNFYE